MTPHINANKEDFSNIVLMPGDPLRAKYIADNFLTNSKLISSVRNIYAYTGFYNDKKISVMASGMGIPSMGIYSYELYKFYDVDVIIRIGSCGAISKDLQLFDTILVDKTYTESNFALSFDNNDCHLINASTEINKIIEKTAIENNIKYIKGDTLCNECFDLYTSTSKIQERIPKNINVIACEMEAFSLFYMAKVLSKKAACLLTVVDSPNYTKQATAEERQNSLNEMIKLGLKSCLKL